MVKYVRKNDIKDSKYYSYKPVGLVFNERLYEETFNSELYESDQQKIIERQLIIDKVEDNKINKNIQYEKVFDLTPKKVITYSVKPNYNNKSLTIFGSDNSSITVNWKYDIINWFVNENTLTFREVDRSTNEQYDRTFNLLNGKVEGSRRVMLEERFEQFVNKSIDMDNERGPVGIGSMPSYPGIQGGPDTTPPVITLNGLSDVTIECGDVYTELGAIAIDKGVNSIPVIITGDTVDTSTLGTYTIIYTATDPAKNASVSTRTVTVVDTTAPVVTLNGSSTVNINISGAYTELDATANDHCDGVLPVTIGGDTVDTFTYNTYTILYTATDSSGNVGTATRIVNILDNIPPVVTLNGDSSINVECGDTYTELNATAVDDKDGALSVTVGGDTVDTTSVGTYTVTYTATDAAGNTTTISRTVIVEDTIAPVVTLNGDSSITVECSDTYTELNATALDDCDGSLSVTVGGDTVDTTSVGTYTVTYSATDSSGNTGTNSRTVAVVDTTAPVVTLNGSSTINVNISGTYTELNATAVDDCDGSLPVTIGGDTVDTFTYNTYTVTYSATDSSGNTGTNSRTVNIVDNVAPVITLNGSSTINVECGGTYDELNATAVDDKDGSLSVTIGGDTVDSNIKGSYTITYTATDAAGNTTTINRTVIVEDTTAPTVTLNGTTPVSAECGSTYNELGATANDICDGALSVTTGGDTVDTGTLGTYTVTYSATDSSGNTGTNSRTVNVLDTIAPVVTLNGSNPLEILIGSTYTELCATAVDDCDGILPVTVGGDTIDTSLSGSFVVTYSATDSSGNTGTNSRTVNLTSPLSICVESGSWLNVTDGGTISGANSPDLIYTENGSSSPPSTGWTKANSNGTDPVTYEHNLTEPTGYDLAVRMRACLRGLAIHVDSTGNITDSIQYGTSTNNLDFVTLLTNAGLVPSTAGCYSYIFEFHGWHRSEPSYTLWASADDMYYIYDASVNEHVPLN